MNDPEPAPTGPSTPDFLAGGGEMGARMRAHDWRTSPLGPLDGWPQSLRAVVALMINSRYPMFVAWGPKLAFLYNDGYRPIFGAKHPHTLGLPFREVWSEIWDDIRPLVERALAGEATFNEDLHLVMERNGYPEDTWYSFSYSPLRDESGRIAGMFCACTETTEKVLAERRVGAERDRLAQLFEQAPTFMALLSGPEHRIERANPSFLRLVQGRPVVGRTVADALPEAVEQGYLAILDEVFRTGQTFTATGARYAMPAVPGGPSSERFLDFVYQPMRDASGQVTGIFVEGFDVTERSRAVAALRESEERFRNVADHAPVMMWVTDATGSCTFLNRHWYEFTGQSEAEAAGFGWLEATHPDDKAAAESLFVVANSRREPFRLEYRLRRGDGVHRWSIDAAAPRFSETGEFLGYVGSVIDIDERREIEERLRTSEARYRTLFEAIDAGFCIIEMIFDPADRPIDYRFVEVNPAFERQTGLVGAAGRTARELVPDLEEHWFEIYGRVAVSGEAARFENGSAAMGRWFDVHALRIGEPAQRRVAVLFNDISERRRAELALRELNERLEERVAEVLAERKVFADIVEGTEAFVQVADREFRWLAINKASADEFERIFGVRPQAGDSMLELLADQPEHQAAVKAVWSRALAGEAFTEIGEFGDPGRARRAYEMRFNTLRDRNGSTVGAYQFVYDVTRRLQDEARLARAEERLRQAQKMEAVGQLTGGVAHDFNNLLQIVAGGLHLLGRRDDPDVRRRAVEGMQQAVERGAALTRQLLAFSRRRPLRPEPIDLAHLIGAMRELLDRSLRGDIRVELSFGQEIWPVLADPSELELALLNLCVNARDALPAGGTITLAAQHLQNFAEGDLHGDFVRLMVSDCGVGMAPEVRARAFEPFFTTKEVGKGSGLGLAQVYGFARQSGGTVEIDSAPDRGTTVALLLPRSLERPAARPQEVAAQSSGAEGGAIEGRILLVEDDQEVAGLTVDMLDAAGLRVTHVPDAAAALDALADGRPIDIVFSDIMMPGGMSGLELAREVRRQRPGLPVVLTTGYETAAAGAAAEGFELLLKPYRSEALLQTLRTQLAGGAGSADSSHSRTATAAR